MNNYNLIQLLSIDISILYDVHGPWREDNNDDLLPGFSLP